MQTIPEPSQTLPVSGTAEVLVAGGGIAGIAAALAAARHGKKVTLLEREYLLGGLATLGLITIYLPLCDGCGNQVVYGLGEELLRLSVKNGHEGVLPTCWLEADGSRDERKEKRFVTQFNPHFFALECERLLLAAGVTVLYGTFVADTVVADDAITHVIVENKSGRSAIAVQSVIDCTGDADVLWHAGAPTALNKDGNALANWYYSYQRDRGVALNMFGLADVPPEDYEKSRKPAYSDAKAVSEIDPRFRFSGVDGPELSLAVQAAHRLMYEDIQKARQDDPTLVPVTISSIPLIRMSRRIVGESVMRIEDDHCRSAESIGMTGNWYRRGPVFEIPFGALRSSKVKNLLAAGRDVSAEGEMWNVMRVIPPCAVTGQAAGTAAALGNDFDSLDIRALQRALETDGVKLHWEEP